MWVYTNNFLKRFSDPSLVLNVGTFKESSLKLKILTICEMIKTLYGLYKYLLEINNNLSSQIYPLNYCGGGKLNNGWRFLKYDISEIL